MGPTARLVTIKRSGVDGIPFPLTLSTCLFGRGTECDIRIQLPVVSKQHCKIEINKQEAILYNFSSTNPTQVNGSAIDEPVPLRHGDIITIIDRSFRYENESRQNRNKSPELPGKIREQKSTRRASRASFSAYPDGKDQDSKAHSNITEGNASRSPRVRVKELTRDSPASDGSKDSAAQKPLMAPSEHPRHGSRNARDLTTENFKEKSTVTLTGCYRELNPFPSTQFFENSKKNESPFKKLYQSMKEEFGVKSQRQNVLQYRKESESPAAYTTEKSSADCPQKETQLSASCKSRPKSNRRSHINSASLPAPEMSQAKGNKSDAEPIQTSKEAVSSSVSLSEVTKVKTPVQHSQQQRSSQKRKHEDLYVTDGEEFVNLGKNEGNKAVDETVTPGKLLTRNQTSDPDNKPGYLSSKKRRCNPTTGEVLHRKIKNQPSLTQCLAQFQRKFPRDSLDNPEKLGVIPGQFCSGLPCLSSVDISNFGDSINKNEDISLKRRRVSFGGHLRPELFDENLPPNTPLKRGETPAKRKSLGTHTPAVLKKIIKEQPQSSGKEVSSEICLEVKAQNACIDAVASRPSITPPRKNDQRRRSVRASTASGGGKSPRETDMPKKAGRKSGHLPSKRGSISRSQHDILQMISSKRRSGASEANLIVAKSWADVVKLGAKQTQTKVVKHGPQRQMNKRQRRPNTPKKPFDSVHNQFSTGHANSPCTIVIGKAQIEKVNAPARPYRMLNSFAFTQKMDYNEDLSGLTEMFKTPVKEKPQMMSICSVTLSDSENLLGKRSQIITSGEEPLLIPSVNLGENVYSSTQNAAKEPSDKCFASPELGKKCIKDEKILRTSRTIHKMTHIEMKTPDPVTETLKTVPGTNKLRRSVELRKMQVLPVQSKIEEMEAVITENIVQKSPRKTPLQKKGKEREIKDSERPLETCKENVELNENSEKMATVRRSRSGGKKYESTGDLTDFKRIPEREPTEYLSGTQMLLQKTACAKKSTNEEETTTQMPCKSLQPEPIHSPISRKRQLKTPLRKEDVKEEVPALRKHLQISGEYIHTVGDGKSVEVFKEIQKQKLDPAIRATGMKKWPRTKKTQPLEDLAGIKELFQEPEHVNEPISEYKAKVPCRSPHREAVDTPRRKKPLPNTSQKKVDVKEEKAMHMSKATVGGDRGIRAFKVIAKQTLDLVANVSGCRGQPRTPKVKAQSLEDLTGFQELFQTPGHAKDSMTEQETPQMPHRSSQSGPVDTSAAPKRYSKTSLGKTDRKEELSTSKKLTQSPGRATHTPTVPITEGKDIRASMQTPKQKLNLTENLTKRKRPARTPKTKAQSLEDLTGFQELFQTPGHAKDSMTEQETPQMPHRSSQSGPVDTSTASKRSSKTSLGKTDGKEELSTSKKLIQSPGRATYNPTVPIPEGKGIRASMQTPKQKLNLTENLTKRKRPARTPKTKAQSLEDLTGFQELFQTPGHAKDSMTEQETPQMPHRSSQSGPVDTSTASKRRSKTSLGKTDRKEELSTSKKLTQSPGRATHTLTVPVTEGKGNRASMQTPKQKLNLTENLTKRKRPARTPKTKAQSLEDLTGFQELFQTPGRAKDSMTEQETPQMPHRSSQSGPVDTSTASKRRSKTSLGKTDRKEELSTSKKLTQSPGRTTHTPTVPIPEGKGIRASMQTPKQKLDLTKNLTEVKRPARTPKAKAQSLEDLTGFQELFQTPGHSKTPVTTEETPRTPCRSPQPMSVDTLTSKRRSKVSLGKVDMKEERSSHSKVTESSDKAMHTLQVPVQEKGIRASTEAPKQKLDQIENLAELERWFGTPKTKALPLEDLGSFQELFQTPGLAKDPVISVQTTKMSLQPAPVDTPTSKRCHKLSLGKVDLKELSPVRELTQMSEKTVYTPNVKVGGDSSICSEESAEQMLNLAANVSGSRRRRRTTKAKAHLLEDLTGFQELFQTLGAAKDPMIADEITKMPCISPQPGPLRTPSTSNRPPRKSLGIVDTKEVLSAPRKLTESPGRALYTPTVPVQEEKGLRESAETTKQKLDTRENLNGFKRQPRTPKEKAQALEDLTGLQELFQTPGHAKDRITPDETTKMPSRFTQPAPLNTPETSKRCPKTAMDKADRKEMSALRKLTQKTEEAMHTSKVLEGDDKVFKDFAEQTLIPEATSSKRQPRKSEEVLLLEDLVGFWEFFRTPGHAKDPINIDEATKTPCISLQTESMHTPTRVVRRSTSLGKNNVNLTQISGKIAHTQEEPTEDKRSEVFKKSTKWKLDPAENVTGNKRLRGGCKKNSQHLEDLTGFRELFQTPGHTKESMSDEQTTKMPCQSQLESVDTPRRKKASPSTSKGNGDMKEGQEIHIPKAIEGEDKSIKAFKDSAKQTLDQVAYVSGSRKRPRTSKSKDQSLEDLAGFQELFQTPGHAKDPVTSDETTKMPFTSLQPRPLYTPTISKRHSKTSLGKTDMKGELSSPRQLTQSPGKPMHTPAVLVQEHEGIRSSTGTPKKKLDLTENLTELKLPAQTSKTKPQPLEDLAGFQELFQTPGLAKDSVTADKPPQTPCRSPQSTPVATRTTSKRRPKISIGKMDVKAQLPTGREGTLRESMHTHKEAIGDKDSKVFKKSAKRKLDPAENVTVTKRLRQAPKEKAQILDLDGLQELFQTPGRTEEAMSDEKAIVTPCKSPHSEPVRIPTSSKSGPRTKLRKTIVKEDSLAVQKPTRISRATIHTSNVPESDDKGIEALKELEKKTLDLAAGVSGSRRWPRAAKARAQFLHDLTGSRGLSQTLGHTKELVRDEKTTKTLRKSPQESGDTSATSKRRPRTRFGKVDVTEELPAQKKQTETSGETMNTHQEPISDGKSIKEFEESAKRKLDPEENVSGSKRLRGTLKEKTQLLEDLAVSKELIQKSAFTEESLRDEKTTKMPCKSLKPEPVDTPPSTKRRLRTRLGNVSVKGFSVVRKPTRMSRATTRTSKVPEGDDQDVKALKESLEQTMDPATIVTSTRRHPRAYKAQSQVEDLPSPKEISQTPDHTDEQINDVHSLKSMLKQTLDSIKPLKTSRRVLRVPKENPVEDLVDTRDPAASQSNNDTSLAPKWKSGKDRGVSGSPGLCLVTTPQDTTEESLVHNKKRTTSRQRCKSPNPLNTVEKCVRVVINRIEPVDKQNNMKSIKKEHTEDSATPNKGMSLRSRHQSKTDTNQQRREVPVSSEKAKIKRHEKKSMQTSEEKDQQNPDNGAGKPTSRSKVSGNRISLRSGRQNKNSQPHTAEEDIKEKSMESPMKNQKEKEVTKNSDTVSLRPRRARIQPKGNTLESESEQSITRGAKRAAENPKKDKDIMDTKKVRTRSQRNIEVI